MKKLKTFSITRINKIDKNDLNCLFEIIKENMIKLGFNVSNDDKESWSGNILNYLKNENFYFYILEFNNKLCGFVELIKEQNNLIVSEVQLNDFAKQTRAILYIIQSLMMCEDFYNEKEIYFSILKLNTMSNKTFSHLGGEVVSENEKKYKYKITRERALSWLRKFK